VATEPPTDTLYPSVDDVGSILRARTQDNDDIEVGTFTPDTRPTDTEVERLIQMAAGVVYGATGPMDDTVLTCPGAEDLRTGAKHWIAVLAAMLVELSYFPEQVKDDRSAYTHYKDLWDDDVMGFGVFRAAVIDCGGGGVEPGGEGGSQSPSWAFPVDVGGMVGWATRW
jgi:hypothetical protein